jgi:hypothetical protein
MIMTYQKIDGVRSQQTLLWGGLMDAIGVNAIQPLCVPDFQFTQHADPWLDLASCFKDQLWLASKRNGI